MSIPILHKFLIASYEVVIVLSLTNVIAFCPHGININNDHHSHSFFEYLNSVYEKGNDLGKEI